MPRARRGLAALLAQGVEAIAISLLHAYRNPVHELELAALVAEMAPGLPVSRSSEIVPEIREFERTSTTVANVYVMPLMARYLEDLERKIRDLGVPGPFYIMLSSGGIATPDTAKRAPIRLVESGPAAGALAAAGLGAAESRGCCRSTWAVRQPRPASSTRASRWWPASSKSRAPTDSRRARGFPSGCPSSR